MFTPSTFHAEIQPKKPVQKLIHERLEATLASRGDGALTWLEVCEVANDYISRDALVTIQDFSVQLALLQEKDGWRKHRQDLSLNIRRCKTKITDAVQLWFVGSPFSRRPCPAHLLSDCDDPGGDCKSHTDTMKMTGRRPCILQRVVWYWQRSTNGGTGVDGFISVLMTMIMLCRSSPRKDYRKISVNYRAVEDSIIELSFGLSG